MTGKDVTYNDGDTVLQGYVASPDTAKTTPLVLIVHQWKGLGEYERHRADMLAEAGYTAFAIDMYGQGNRPADTEQAAAESAIYKNDPQKARKRLKAALNYGQSLPKVNANKVIIIGYCFGGTMALELARSGADIDGAISFHGGLTSKSPITPKDTIKAELQIHHGAQDPHVPPTDVAQFVTEMTGTGIDYSLYAYKNAVHAFTEHQAGNDPTGGVAYNAAADHKSWARALAFMQRKFNPDK